ncbi:FUSC family protein [Rhodanobacter sp. DHB23]|uniref:FUSC family protein n=1 Tax=Rhodanobacter sp. DHB23 TaxID=2775923 RepID=UPI0017842F14|nr:FUSC family protein [Rhodanobacter sp. DHB23]MBD8872963.1 FUSC family protein [Rhodanobacter sp. DHB23]
MSSSGYSLRVQFIETLTLIKRPDVPLRVVLRNTLAVVLPLAAGLATGYPEVGLGVGAGALDTMFSDQPGPYRQRMRLLLLAALVAGVAALLGFTIGGQLLPMLLVTAVFGFCGGMLVVFGTDAARVGMTSMILLVIAAATPVSPRNALLASGLIASGGLLLTLFAVAAWPLQRYRPERHALAGVYAGLATLARQPGDDENANPALTDAMTSLQHTLLGRYRAHGRAMEAFAVLLELAERIRLELTAISALHANPAMHARYREDAAHVLDAIAHALETAEPPQQAERALQALRNDSRAVPDGLASHLRALDGQLAAAVRNANWAGSRGELRAAAAETQLPRTLQSGSAWAVLHANLTPRSVAFRHAIRTAACLSMALLVSRLLKLPHGYWLPMTTAIVLRADFAATFNFGLLRVVGTVLGLVLTTALLHLTPASPWAHLALMAVLCMAFRWLANAHYGIAVAALTGTVVILLSYEGVNSGVAVTDRVINTVLGCAMAMATYLMWPTWERGRARAALAEMLDAYASYLRALAVPGQREAQRETRSLARTARSNAAASLERMRTEPATPQALLELARTLFANGNRLARTAMALEALGNDPSSRPAAVNDFVASCASATQSIADALRERRAPENLPDLRALQQSLPGALAQAGEPATGEALLQLGDRLANNINTLAHVLRRAQAVSAGT